MEQEEKALSNPDSADAVLTESEAAAVPQTDSQDEFVHEEGEVVITGPLRFSDYFAFRLRYGYFSAASLGFWALVLLCAVFLIVGWDKYDTTMKVVLFVVLGFVLIYQPFTTALQTLQMTANLKMQNVEFRYTVNSTGILVEDGTNHEVIRWDMFRKVKETRKRYFLYVMKNSAFIFGKDVLGEQEAAFRRFLENCPVRKQG